MGELKLVYEFFFFSVILVDVKKDDNIMYLIMFLYIL